MAPFGAGLWAVPDSGVLSGAACSLGVLGRPRSHCAAASRRAGLLPASKVAPFNLQSIAGMIHCLPSSCLAIVAMAGRCVARDHLHERILTS